MTFVIESDTMNPRPLLPRLCGWLVLALGIELIAGWLLHVESMVKIVPGSNSVSFNTAVAFVLCGSALLVPPRSARLHWRQVVAAILVLGGSAILYEDLFDVALGLDWVALHRVVQDGSPRPGRVAPNTCAALILLGTMLFQSGKPDSAFRRLLMPVCSILLAVLVVTGIAGVLLDPTLLFGWYKFNRMAAPTAFGVSLCAMGLYAEYRAQAACRPLSAQQQEKSIFWSGSLILLAMGMAGVITTAVIFANHEQASIRDRLQAELTFQRKLAEVVISQSAAETTSLNARPLLRALIQRVALRRDPADLALLSSSMEQRMQQGFAGQSLSWTDGSPTISAGHTDLRADLAIPLREPAGGELLWRGAGFFFRMVSEVRATSGHVIGHMTTERRLDTLSSVYTPVTDSADSAEAMLCGKLNDGIACFPSKLHPSPMFLPAPGQRSRLPLDDAMDGRSGGRVAQDHRGITAVMAYSPLAATGLVILSKVDAVEAYAPIAYLLWRSLAVLVVSMLVCVVLLRSTVSPLVKAITRSETRAVESERRLKAITDNVPALIGFIDRNLKHQFMNATYERWFGKPVAELLGATPSELLGAEGHARALPKMEQALRGEHVQFTDATASPQANHPRFVSVSYIPDRSDDGTVLGFNVLAFDTTEQHQHEQALTHLAHHDGLTDLPNRRLFEDRLAHALTHRPRHDELIALIYLDIDHFKQINDTLGHDQGDMLLRAFAQRLRNAVRSSDTVARLGGDEFVVLMEGLPSPDDAMVVATKILTAIRVPFDLASGHRLVTTSMGMSYSKGGGDAPARVLQCSDAALYEAKAAGRDRVHVYAEAPTASIA